MADLFERRFTAANGGAKDPYDVKQHVRDRGQHAKPGTVVWFLHTLRDGRYADGGYPKYWQTEDGGTLSYAACRDNAGLIARAMRDGHDAQWCVVACLVNWEDTGLYCEHTGERIESAYAEPEPEPARKPAVPLDPSGNPSQPSPSAVSYLDPSDAPDEP